MGGELRTYAGYNEIVDNENVGSFFFNGRFTGDAYTDFLLGLPTSSTRLLDRQNKRNLFNPLG